MKVVLCNEYPKRPWAWSMGGHAGSTFRPQQIAPGFMILVGITDEDGDKQIAWLAHKIESQGVRGSEVR